LPCPVDSAESAGTGPSTPSSPLATSPTLVPPSTVTPAAAGPALLLTESPPCKLSSPASAGYASYMGRLRFDSKKFPLESIYDSHTTRPAKQEKKPRTCALRLSPGGEQEEEKPLENLPPASLLVTASAKSPQPPHAKKKSGQGGIGLWIGREISGLPKSWTTVLQHMFHSPARQRRHAAIHPEPTRAHVRHVSAGPPPL
jgi:hypothetical protein